MFGIFDRPMEPADAAEVREVEALPITSDLEKYLLLPQEPLGTDVLAPRVEGGRSATMPLRQIRSLAALRGFLTLLVWHASGWVAQAHRQASSASSPRRARCITISRARWRTAPLSTHSSPQPTPSEVYQSMYGCLPEKIGFPMLFCVSAL